VRRFVDIIIALVALVFHRRLTRLDGPDRIVALGSPDRRAENGVLLLFGASALSAVAFIATYALDRLPDQTQYLGLSLGLAFLFLAAALIVIGKRLVVTEELVEDYPKLESPPQQAQIEQILAESDDRFTRKRLVLVAGTGTVTAVGAALVAPLASLGPVLDLASLVATPWHAGRRLVGQDEKPLAAASIEEGSFYTGFPEDAPHDQFAAPLIVVRLPAANLHLPTGRRHWAPDGIVAYSKICTHAGCAISLYRKPTFAPTEAKPALVCPCHYSTFDPAAGGSVLFGPAGRSLPQLPLMIDTDGNLRASGNFSGPVGPSWWGVRSRKPTG
jgi:ubiquinol-cytochrome c reductase iron-sulfur subunit